MLGKEYARVILTAYYVVVDVYFVYLLVHIAVYDYTF